MMILEHGDMGCGIAMMFHMPERGCSLGKRDPWGNNDSTYESVDEYKERFLNSTLKQRRLFTTHENQTMCSDGFTVNGKMKDGTTILHLRTAREWLFEYPKRTSTLITLGKTQHDTSKLGEVLLSVGFKLLDKYPNPIMSWSPVYLYQFPAVTQDEQKTLSASWQEKLDKEREAMESFGMSAKSGDLRPSTYKHEGL